LSTCAGACVIFAADGSGGGVANVNIGTCRRGVRRRGFRDEKHGADVDLPAK
jgi:hypothetical protein